MRTSRLLPHCLLLLLLLMLASSVFFSQTSIAPKAVSALPTQQWVSVVDKVRGAIVTIETQLALGTGFLVAKNGTIVTNYHVIKDAQQITITLQNGEIYRSAYLLRTDEDRDIAMLRIQGADLPFISLGNSDAVKVGEDVLAIGTPEGLEQTASNGIISARRVGSGYELLQTTAPISHGSSGGPLLNRAGQSIGVMTLFLNEGQNLNFAVPINYVREMLDSLDLSSNQSARLISGNAQKISNKPVLTVTASSPIVTYGDPVPGVMPTYAGFVNGDSASVLYIRA